MHSVEAKCGNLKKKTSGHTAIVIRGYIKVLFDILHSVCEEFHVYVPILFTS